MHYEESPAPPDLAPHVRRFWSLRDEPEQRAAALPRAIERVIPDGRMELVVHLGDRFCEIAHAGGGPVLAPRPQPRALLAGQLSGPLFLRPGRAIDLFAIRFEPWGAATLLGLDAAAFAGRIVALDEAVGAAADRLVDTLAGAATVAGRIAAAVSWLRERSARNASRPRDPAWLRAVVQAAQRAPQRHTVATLAALAGAGRRELERRFARHVGLAPKPFLRVARVQRTIAALDAAPHFPLASLALAHGYCDQGHWTREFGAVTGTTPARFLRERRGLETLLHDPAPLAAAIPAPSAPAVTSRD